MTTPTPTRGPCSPWDPIWCCDLTTESPITTGDAAMMATEVLYNLSGQLFDICEFTLRPCRKDCNDQQWTGGFFGGSGQWWEWGGMWPRPVLFDGAWFNLTCGGCRGSCSCSPLSEAWLPGPVAQVVSVKLDGQTLPASGYRIDDFRKLVRLGGEHWPLCQDMTLADDQPNTWSATVQIGETVPMIGRLAVGELACQIRAACAGENCSIPRTATVVTRQGITIELPTLQELLERGMLGLHWSDIFVSTYNPRRLTAVPLVFDVDGPSFRRTNT